MPDSKDDKKESKSLDILGTKPIADAISHATTKTIDGIGAVLSRICLPAAEEFGLALKDRVSQWRAKNLEQTFSIAKDQIDQISESENIEAHPRLVHEIVEGASWTDDATLQNMWAGLLTSSCSSDGQSQGNLLLIRLVSQLTPSQAKLLILSVERTPKERYEGGWIGPKLRGNPIAIPVDELRHTSGEEDLHALDLQLDHLRALGLIDGGFDQRAAPEAEISATAMAMQLYARAKGWRGSIDEFYGLQKTDTQSP